MGHDHCRVDLRQCAPQTRAVLADRFRLSHATLHVRTAGDRECAEMKW